jgi:hypothetical protein
VNDRQLFSRWAFGVAALLGPWSPGCGGGAHDTNQQTPKAMAPSDSSADAGHSGDTAGHGAAGASVAMHAQDAGASPKDAHVSTPADAGSDSMSTAPESVAFRVSELYVRDPHMYLGTTDITDTPLLGTSVNGSLISNGLTMDYDMDGFLDVSILPVFAPLDAKAATASVRLVDARCSLADAHKCEASEKPGLDAHWTIENRSQGACLEPMPDTTSDFKPAVSVPMAPCFVTTEGQDLTINLGGINIAMTATRIAATYEGDPVTRLVDGLLAGFVTDAHAKEALLPAYLPLIGGTPLTDYLQKTDADSSTSPTGEGGFWLYINFVATPVDYSAE